MEYVPNWVESLVNRDPNGCSVCFESVIRDLDLAECVCVGGGSRRGVEVWEMLLM